ncbi:MAG: hypothetical protein ABI041_18035, partial [Bdellovibrionia bacterium]
MRHSIFPVSILWIAFIAVSWAENLSLGAFGGAIVPPNIAVLPSSDPLPDMVERISPGVVNVSSTTVF